MLMISIHLVSPFRSKELRWLGPIVAHTLRQAFETQGQALCLRVPRFSGIEFLGTHIPDPTHVSKEKLVSFHIRTLLNEGIFLRISPDIKCRKVVSR